MTMTIGELIRKRRKALDLSQSQLAKMVRGRPHWISMLENGTSRFPKAKWQTFADALEIDQLEFLNAVLRDILGIDRYILIRKEDED